MPPSGLWRINKVPPFFKKQTATTGENRFLLLFIAVTDLECQFLGELLDFSGSYIILKTENP